MAPPVPSLKTAAVKGNEPADAHSLALASRGTLARDQPRGQFSLGARYPKARKRLQDILDATYELIAEEGQQGPLRKPLQSAPKSLKAPFVITFQPRRNCCWLSSKLA